MGSLAFEPALMLLEDLLERALAQPNLMRLLWMHLRSEE
jgi:hypothetical protein